MDEIDGYPLDIDGEGSPMKLVENRAVTFGSRKKIAKTSTPTVSGQSAIEKELVETEINKYFVPCPHCGSEQELVFSQLRWERGNYDNVEYECSHCHEHISERSKTKMLEGGRWKPTQPEKIRKYIRGYHINGLYSPAGWLTWAQIAREHDEAHGDEPRWKTFVNTKLGETYAESGDVPEWESLYERRENYTTEKISDRVCFLTAGVDVQRDRLELEVVGWCRGKRSYSIDYRVLSGDTSTEKPWLELSQVLDGKYEREDGTVLNIRMMCVDSGYNTSMVYQFCGRQDSSRVVAVKGSDTLDKMVSSPKRINVSRTGKVLPGVLLSTIGVNVLKSELYGWLRQHKTEEGEPIGYCHFPQYDERYFRGLLSEKLITKIDNKGFSRLQWHKFYDRNEPLDCRIYARAAATLFGMDRMRDETWDMLEAGDFPQKTSSFQQKDQKSTNIQKKSSFLGNRWKK